MSPPMDRETGERIASALERIATALEGAQRVEQLDDEGLQRQVVEGKREMYRRLRLPPRGTQR